MNNVHGSFVLVSKLCIVPCVKLCACNFVMHLDGLYICVNYVLVTC